MLLRLFLLLCFWSCISAHSVHKRADYSIPQYNQPPERPLFNLNTDRDEGSDAGFPWTRVLGTVGLLAAPVLAAVGLAGVIPVVIGGLRKKRSLPDGEETGLDDMTTRINNIYLAVMNSEECMQRIICEAGGVMKDVTAKDSLFSILGSIAPHSFKKYVHTFKDGAYSKDVTKCQKIKCGLMQ